MFRSWFSKWLAARRKKSIAQRATKRNTSSRFRPGLECLEDRAVPAFLAPASYAAGANPAGIAVGDYNGDGRADLAVANQTLDGDRRHPAEQRRRHVPADASITPPGPNPIDAKAGDFNGDGKADLAVVGILTATVNVLLGNGDGTFAAPTSLRHRGLRPTRSTSATSTTTASSTSRTMNVGTASVLLGNGDGTFQAAPRRRRSRQLHQHSSSATSTATATSTWPRRTPPASARSPC